jgi:hypothetical protein
MPVYTRSGPPALAIQFDRDGEESEVHVVVGSGERVLLHAMGILVRRRALQLHDRLIVREAIEGVDIPGDDAA